MKKFKINVQRYICIFLCLVLYITVLPFSVSAAEAKNQTVRVGWYEGTYDTTGPDGKKRGYRYEYQQAVAAHTGSVSYTHLDVYKRQAFMQGRMLIILQKHRTTRSRATPKK